MIYTSNAILTLISLFTICSMSYAGRTISRNPIILKPQKLEIIDQEPGEITGEQAKIGDTVSVHYTGKLTDGTKFDSSIERGMPLTFTLGKHMVIPGFEKGVEGMHVGGKRTLRIPPEMAYGERGAGGIIPPYSTLVFDITLVSIDHEDGSNE